MVEGRSSESALLKLMCGRERSDQVQVIWTACGSSALFKQIYGVNYFFLSEVIVECIKFNVILFCHARSHVRTDRMRAFAEIKKEMQ